MDFALTHGTLLHALSLLRRKFETVNFFRSHSTTLILTIHRHSHPHKYTYTNPIPMRIFEDLADKFSRLTKSPQTSHCRRERRLPLKAQNR